jgi:vacuolar-type H+-ATPase subunit I/STV1
MPVYGEETLKRNPARQIQALKKTAIKWRINKKSLISSLDVMSRDPACRPIARMYREELHATDKTLIQAEQLVNQQEKDPKEISRIAVKLEGHRKSLRDIQEELYRVEREKENVRSERQPRLENLQQERARNEKEKMKSFFQGWQEKANQVDQQLTNILRVFKDLGRVGVGGSDLGAS